MPASMLRKVQLCESVGVGHGGVHGDGTADSVTDVSLDIVPAFISTVHGHIGPSYHRGAHGTAWQGQNHAGRVIPGPAVLPWGRIWHKRGQCGRKYNLRHSTRRRRTGSQQRLTTRYRRNAGCRICTSDGDCSQT
jgi:hypothetical protein